MSPNDSELESTEVQDQRALAFSYNFHPQQGFEVIDQLEQGTTVRLLQVDEAPVAEISQPDEWTGYVVRYVGSEVAGVTTFLFLRETSLSAGELATFDSDASMYAPELLLIDAGIEAVEGDAEDEDGAVDDRETEGDAPGDDAKDDRGLGGESDAEADDDEGEPGGTTEGDGTDEHDTSETDPVDEGDDDDGNGLEIIVCDRNWNCIEVDGWPPMTR